MAQFRGTLKGNRDEVSRLGHKTTGLTAKISGWNAGCSIEIAHEEGRDIVRVYATGGSNHLSNKQLVSTITESADVPGVIEADSVNLI